MSERIVETRFKDAGACQCQCGMSGTYKVKPNKDGLKHTRNCDKKKCAGCRGRNSKRSGGVAQRTAAKRLKLTTSTIKTGHEESYLGALRIEAKSGAQIRPLVTAFDKGHAQSEAARAPQDHRPFLHAAIPEPNGKRVIYSFESHCDQDVIDVGIAICEQYGLTVVSE